MSSSRTRASSPGVAIESSMGILLVSLFYRRAPPSVLRWRGPFSSSAAGLEFQRFHAVGLSQGAGVGVADADDVSQHLVDGPGIALPLCDGPAGQALEFGD